MKRLHGIIESTTPPNTNMLWLNKGVIKYFRNGKWINTGLTEDQSDIIQKFLDAYGDLPENLDTLKEIINTPANFLNNKSELGGIINMPFGYEGAPVQVYDSLILGNSDNDAGEISGFYYNQLVVTYESHNIINATRTVKINSIRGEENKVNLYGIISIYVDNSNHLHIVNEAHFDTSAIIYFKAFYSYKKLPLEFTTPYIVGNDTQEQLDELYSKLINELDFTSNVYIVDGKGHRIVGLGIFKHTYGDNWIINIITTNNTNGYTEYVIGGSNGQNLKELITLGSVDGSLIIEKSNLVPTPNWNASEGEPGYIENKPCYVNLNNGRRITLDNADITLSSDKNWYEQIIIPINENRISLYFYNFNGELIHYVLSEGQSVFDMDFGCKFTAVLNEYYSCDLLLTDFSDPKDYIDTTFAEKVLVYEYNNLIVQKLDSMYLPDTVLKTTPQSLSTAAKNQALTNLGIADLLEALKPVQLSGDIPIGNVTQEQLDEIGLTSKVIANICNGYTRNIKIRDSIYNIIYISKTNDVNYVFTIARYEFEQNGSVDYLTQYKIVSAGGEITIGLKDI